MKHAIKDTPSRNRRNLFTQSMGNVPRHLLPRFRGPGTESQALGENSLFTDWVSRNTRNIVWKSKSDWERHITPKNSCPKAQGVKNGRHVKRLRTKIRIISFPSKLVSGVADQVGSRSRVTCLGVGAAPCRCAGSPKFQTPYS